MAETHTHEVHAQLFGDSYTTEIEVNQHHLTADEPIELDGLNLGPTPYEILTSALAACTAITVKMYARRKKWPLQEIDVKISHDKIHAEDCKNCNDPKTGMIDQFTRKIKFSGELDNEQVERLLYIADRCPVHKTLSSGASILTELVN
ncbi:MAG: OsmC family protein [Calditrichaeota bacterium]|nr:OsmC family protein [Calditrichota bacterium]